MSTENPLPADATYDDQGVHVSLIIGGVLLVMFGGIMAFLHYTPILWLKRFYRSNHTIEPTPLPTRKVSAAAVAAAPHLGGREGQYERSHLPSPLTESPLVEHTVRPHGRNGPCMTRRKRLGISLPFLSTFFILPTWEDWISIEEPSLGDRKESALSPLHYQYPSPPRRPTSDRSFIPLTVSPARFPRRINRRVSRTESEADCRDSVEASTAPTPFSSQSRPSLPSYGAVEESRAPQCPPDTPCRPPLVSAQMPKTPVDPLVAVYLFTLKFFFSLMFLGELFTAWIMLIAQQDNFMERTIVQRDIHGCAKQATNMTACELLKPYCAYLDDTQGCGVVALHGLYDLTVLNIHPRSRRWVGVALLNLGFCVTLVGVTLFYVKRVGQYAEAVMANQMRHALGYRVVCVRGLGSDEIHTEHAFREAFLQLPVYFPTPSTPSTAGASEDNGSEHRYVVWECPGLNSLFSGASMHHYVFRRCSVTFTDPGKVEQILITREPPVGMLELIAETEAAMANLQDAIADEKALQRRQMQKRRTLALTKRRRVSNVIVMNVEAVSVEEEAAHSASGNDRADAVLMMRAPFPDCCSMIPAVDFYTTSFFRCARQLNMALERVPHQQVAGAAFVVFKDSLSAYEFTQLFTARFGGLLSSLTATIAGPPGRIFQSNLTASRCVLWVRFLFILVLYIVLMLTWSIPVSVLGSLEQLSEMSSFVVLRKYSKLPKWLRTLLNSYLPVAALAILNIALPHIIRLMVRAMGAFNRAECDSGQLYLQYIFMVVTAVIFQAAFQGAITGLADLLAQADQDAIINFFVSCISPSNGYFYAKVITSTCLSTWVDLVDPIGILKVLLLRGRAHIQRNYDALFLPCEFEFPRLLSFDLMVLSLGLIFHMTAPLLGLLVVCYFFVRYWSQRAKQCDRYRPTLSPAHDCTDFGVAAQVIRCVMGLYCFSEGCGVLLMTLRSHRSGTAMCALALSTGVILTVYVYIQTAKWTTSLARARYFARNANLFYSQDAAQQMGPATAVVPTPPPPPPRTCSPPPDLAASGGSPGTRAEAPCSQQHTSWEPLSEEEDAAAGQQYNSYNQWTSLREEEFLDSYEHITLNRVLFDTTRNPFLSYLLPRKAGTVLRYQPKHQRLATIDAAAELRAMKNTDFVVERYWDRGMTWFEGDAGACGDLVGSGARYEGGSEKFAIRDTSQGEAPRANYINLMDNHDVLMAQISAAVPPALSSRSPTTTAVSRVYLVPSSPTQSTAELIAPLVAAVAPTSPVVDVPTVENAPCNAARPQCDSRERGDVSPRTGTPTAELALDSPQPSPHARE